MSKNKKWIGKRKRFYRYYVDPRTLREKGTEAALEEMRWMNLNKSPNDDVPWSKFDSF